MQGQTVVLHHTEGDGASHYDWMVGGTGRRAPDGGAGLVTFRMADRVDRAKVGAVLGAELIGVHREAYLAYEGELSRGRGSVKRVARGSCEVVEDAEGRLVVQADFGAGAVRLTAERAGGGDRSWRVLVGAV